MKIYLAQHGKAVDEKVDPQRPLSETGVIETTRIAGALANSGLVSVEKILHSGKLRAMQTAQIFAGALCGSDRVEKMDGINPLDGAAACVNEIENAAGGLMIVGHLPNLSKVVSKLVTGDENAGIVSFKYSGVISLEKQGDGKWAVVPLLYF